MRLRSKFAIVTVILVIAFLVLPVSMYFLTQEYVQTVSSVPLPYVSSSEAYDPQNGFIYITCLNDGSLLVYNSTNYKMLENVSTGGLGSSSFNSGEIYDPHNGMLYFEEEFVVSKVFRSGYTGLVVFNTYNNSVAKIFDLGGNNFVLSIVLNPINGDVFVSEGANILLINGTKIVNSYSINNGYNDDTYFTFNPHTNTSYLLYMTYGQLLATDNLTPTNTTFDQFNYNLPGIYYLNYIPKLNQLFVGSSDKLYSINPANISDVLYIVNLTSKNGIGPVVYSPSLGRFYVTAGSTIQVINATSGSTLGVIRMDSQIYIPSGIAQIPNGNFLVTDGPWLYVLNDKLDHLEPYYPNVEGALILSTIIIGIAAATSYGALYLRGKGN